MTTPFSIVIVKPMTVLRGHWGGVIENILRGTQTTLRSIRYNQICRNTLLGLEDVTKDTSSPFILDDEISIDNIPKKSIICLLTHIDRETDPTESIQSLCGPKGMKSWVNTHLRFKYSRYATAGKTTHKTDTVVYIAPSEKVDLIGKILLEDFDVEKV